MRLQTHNYAHAIDAIACGRNYTTAMTLGGPYVTHTHVTSADFSRSFGIITATTDTSGAVTYVAMSTGAQPRAIAWDMQDPNA